MPTRARDLGLNFPGTPGPHNAITDVPGVRVGYTTLTERPNAAGEGAHIQTGVTAIHPLGVRDTPAYVWAGQHTLNGNGEMTGSHWLKDAGYFMSPICITNTHSVGMAHHATLSWMVEQYRDYFTANHCFAMPVIAETYDGILNDINGLHLRESHVLDALNNSTSGPLAEGNVGGGNGMISYEYKAGTGTASRQVSIENEHYTLGVLVQSNFGARGDLSILGRPVGQLLPNDGISAQVKQVEQGSIIVIIATDAPLIPTQLDRIARRATLGIARTGTIGGHSSGDIFLAFSTANAMPLDEAATPVAQPLSALGDVHLDHLYRAARDGVEEAIINSMVAGVASEAFKPKGLTVPALGHAALRRLTL